MLQCAAFLLISSVVMALFFSVFHAGDNRLQAHREEEVRSALQTRMALEIQLLQNDLDRWMHTPLETDAHTVLLVNRGFELLIHNQALARIVLLKESGEVYDYSTGASLVRYPEARAQLIFGQERAGVHQSGSLYYFPPLSDGQADAFFGHFQLVLQSPDSNDRIHFVLKDSLPEEIAADLLTPENLAHFADFDSSRWADFFFSDTAFPDQFQRELSGWALWFSGAAAVVWIACAAASYCIGASSTRRYEGVVNLFFKRITANRLEKEPRAPAESPVLTMVLRSYLLSVLLPCLTLAAMLGGVLIFVLFGELHSVYPQRIKSAASDVGYLYKTGVQTCMHGYNSANLALLYKGRGHAIRFRDYQRLLDEFLQVKATLPSVHNVAFYNDRKQNVYSSVYFDTAPISSYHNSDILQMENANGDYVPFLSTLRDPRQGAQPLLHIGKTNYRGGNYSYSKSVAGYMVFSFDLGEIYARNRLAAGNISFQPPRDATGSPENGGGLSPAFSARVPMLAVQLTHSAALPVYLAPYLPPVAAIARGGVYSTGAALLGMLAVCILSVYLPMRKIKRDMYKVYKAYRSENRSRLPQKNEISILEDYFHEMVDRVEMLAYESYQDKMRLKELELQENQAQLKALQHQINPHFLHNTLEALKWMALKHNTIDIYDMVMAMSKLYRFSLIRDGESLVTLRTELDNLTQYIFLQQLRFPEKFTVSFDIEENAQEYRVPKLILQPLVENAIEHGFQAIEEGGVIQVCAGVVQAELVITVTDNGCGMTAEQMQRVNDAASGSNPDPEPLDSIALVNIATRLRLIHGGQRFSISSGSPQGTRVLIRVPVEACL